MKKNYLIILAVVIIVVGGAALFLLTRPKKCSDLDEQACKKADQCLSVLVPCRGPECAHAAVFKECKDKN
ncbi:MAG: hypothetical protein V1668_04120 [Patescibacteria group bacterium]